jgi:ABC-type phosphate transport system permease subunit
MQVNPLHSVAAMPTTIYSDASQPQANVQTAAWATALMLVVFILVLSVIGRTLAAYFNRHAR